MAEYAKNWDSYYRRTYRLLESKSLWEVSPERAVEIDKERFLPHFNAELPIIDIGCGTGEQAMCLKKYAPKVVGVDVADTAVVIANERYKDAADVSFSTFDIADVETAKQMAAEHGDSNIYIRGVLHQTLPEDRAKILQTILTLLGEKGKLYMMEVADNIRAHLQEKVPSFSDLPAHMRRALMSNLPPVGLSVENLPEWFPESSFSILEAGDGFLATNLVLPDESILGVPAVYAVISPNIT